jgi:hypothetical protein
VREDGNDRGPAVRLTDEQMALLERAIRELHWSQNTPRERDAAEGVVDAARRIGIIRS